MNNKKKIGLEAWRALRREWTRKPTNFKPASKKIDSDRVLDELEDYPDCPPQYSPTVPLNDMVLIIQQYWKNQEEAEKFVGKL
eukprot:gene2177-2041_t